MDTELGARIIEHARRTPDRPLFRDARHTTTAADLCGRAAALGAMLRAEVPAGERVALLLPRGHALGVATLACYLHGVAYVPLDPAHPDAHTAAVLRRAQPRVALCAPGVTPLAPEVRTLDTEPDGTPVLDGHAVAPAGLDALPGVDPAATAYVCFTSGSSGAPKGVVVDRAALENYVRWASRVLPPAGDGAPLFSSPAFDHSVTCLYVPWAHGECVTAIADNADPIALRDALTTGLRFSFVKITPSHLRMVEAAGGVDWPAVTAALLVGGEAFPTATVADIRRRHPDLRIVNHYGPTEATVGCCAYELSPGAVPSDDPVPIGRPIDGMTADVDVPGEEGAGELVVSGAGVARGYLADSRATDASFRTGSDGVRSYRTGDLVRRDDAGDLLYLGRVDRQVKVHGVRVECGAVETALVGCNGVRAAHVAVVAGTDAGTRLVAYAVPDRTRDTPGPDGEHLRVLLRERLPAAWVPSTVAVVDALPITVHGKVDLTPFDTPRTAPEPDTVDAGRPVLSGVREEVAAVLAVPTPTVDVDAGLVEQGASSMAVAFLVVRLAERFGRDVRLRDVLAAGSVRSLAASVERSPDAAKRGPDADGQGADWVPLTPPELAIWNFGLLRRSAPYLHCGSVFRAVDRPTAVAFARALADEIARRPEVLRRFSSPAGVPSSRPADEAQAELVDDPRGLDGMRAWFAEPFALRRGRTARVVVGRDGLVGLFIHHLVSDGISQDVLVRSAARHMRAGGVPEPIWRADDRRPAVPDLDHGAAGHWGPAVPIEVGPDRAAKLGRTARAHGVSRFTMLLSEVLDTAAGTGRFGPVVPYVMLAGRDTAAEWEALGCRAHGVVLPLVEPGARVDARRIADAVRMARERPPADRHTDAPDGATTLLFQLEEALAVPDGLECVAPFASSGIGPLGPTDLHLVLVDDGGWIDGQAVYDPERVRGEDVRDLVDDLLHRARSRR